jgi:RNA polymerase sigma-70 factor (ECF subfamily)
VHSAIDAVRSGDSDAFSQLVKLYQRRLFSLVLMMTRDPSGADEVTQDAFVRAFTHLYHYDARRPFYPWLATIAVRTAQAWLRRQRRTALRHGEITAGTDRAGEGPDQLGELIAEEDGRRLWQAVAALPSGQRTAAFLYYRQEMKVDDVARALGVSSGTVKTLLSRARRRLREHAERRESACALSARVREEGA